MSYFGHTKKYFFGGATLEDETTIEDAEDALLAGANDDRVNVINPYTGGIFCQLRRLSSGVNMAAFADFRNALESMFVIGTNSTDDIVLSNASVDLDFHATRGLRHLPSGADGLIIPRCLGAFNPRVHGLISRCAFDVTTAGDASYGFVGLTRLTTLYGLTGGVVRVAGAWNNRGIYGTLTAPASSGGGAIGAPPVTGRSYVMHAGRQGSTQSYASSGYCDDANPPSVPGYLSGAHVSNWDTATAFYLLLGAIRVGGGNDLTPSIATVFMGGS